MSADSLALLRGLLEQYSPTGQEAGAARFLIQSMRALGFDQAYLDEIGNPVGVRGSGPREIMLLGHIDTVPGQIEVELDGDRLYGRGAVDAKGPLACFTAAAAQVTVPDGWRLRVVGALGEEGDSRGAHYLARHAAPPEMVFIGEPSRWDRVCLGYKGSLWLAYHVEQPLAHTAGRSSSACEEAAAFWNRVVSYTQEFNAAQGEKVFNQLTPTLREMHSNLDGFTESAGLKIGIRLPLGKQPDELIADLRGLAQPGSLAGKADLTILDSIPAYRADKNAPLVRAMLAAIRAAGGQPGFSVKTGTADMNIVAPVWNCPVVAYGPGDSNLDHTPEEHILVSEYHQAVQVLADGLQRLMS